MHLDYKPNSPDHFSKLYPDGVRVFVDGELVDNVLELDTEEGWVRRYELPENEGGEIFYLDIKEQRLTGKVTLKWGRG